MGIDLSIVIVNWHSKAYLKACLQSVFTQTHGLSLEVLVIDSASFDGCDRMLAECYPDVRFIQSDVNLGFAKANNRAYDESSGDCVLFLNPDTEVMGPAINVLHSALQTRPHAGIVGGTLLNTDRTLQSSCVLAVPTILNRLVDSDLLKARWPRSALWGMAPLYEGAPDAREVEAISGACLMVKRRVFDEVGKFSEDYFMYAEDVDLSHKVRSVGYQNYYVPDATIIHHGGSSSKESVSTFAAVMMPEATLRFFRKTRGSGYALLYRLGMCASAVGRLIALGFAVPVSLRNGRNAAWSASCLKWIAVLRWALSRHALVEKYYPRSS